MTKNPKNPLITTTNELQTACEACKKHSYFSIDTEFIRENTYYPKLCLIQIATNDTTYIIDPLSPHINLSALYELLQNPTITKIFHAAEQDIEIFYYLMGTHPTPIFDSQIAAMVCGYGDAMSYTKLVAKITGTTLDKTNQFTDWAQRPLSNTQLEYAKNDVTYLLDIYKHLHETIHTLNRETWLEEETKPLTNVKKYQHSPTNAWKKIRTTNRTKNFLHRLKYLAQWREEQAQQQDVPRNIIAKDHALLLLASCNPLTAEAFLSLSRLPSTLKTHKTAKEITRLLQKANETDIANDVIETPKKPLDPKYDPLISLLKVLLTVKAQQHQVSEKIITSKKHLQNLASKSYDELTAIQCPLLSGWRYDIFGKDALALKEGKISLSICAKTGKIDVNESK